MFVKKKILNIFAPTRIGEFNNTTYYVVLHLYKQFNI